eukprot:m.53484 g.53484  ORF g.53484 m.53484 type:complete len:661 (-) comp13566_c0_seq4:113-2095(-)
MFRISLSRALPSLRLYSAPARSLHSIPASLSIIMDSVPKGSSHGRGRGNRRGRGGRGGRGGRRGRGAHTIAQSGARGGHGGPRQGQAVFAQPPTVKPAGAIAASLSSMAFADMPGLNPDIRAALVSDFGYTHASGIQEQAIPIGLEGNDLIAQARTGTGKTIAFLTPTIQKQAEQPPSDAIGALVLAPTRELAQQIEREAKVLGKRLGVKTVVVMGGTNMKADVRALQHGTGILVATPGRLNDHIENTSGFAEKLKRCHTVILDECDRMLDMGFKPDLQRIMAALPPPARRQALMFSATMPDGIRQLASQFLKPKHDYVSTVDPNEAPTHEIITQEAYAVLPSTLFPSLFTTIHHHLATVDPESYKIIIFFPTARMAQFMASLFRECLPELGVRPADILDVHSRKSQSARMKACDAFKNRNQTLLFSSDVSARGMDFPDVTLVVQVGLTDHEQYIHRLGRTARAGKAGYGCLIALASTASYLSTQLADLPLTSPGLAGESVVSGGAAAGLQLVSGTGAIDGQRYNSPWPVVVDVVSPQTELIQAALHAVGNPASDLNTQATMAYASWLGFYKGSLRKLRWSPEDLVETCNNVFAGPQSLGLLEVPALQAKSLGKMGLRGVMGIREEGRGAGGRQSNGRGGGRGGRGGGQRGRGGRGRGRH